ncbi:hypothetical protein [Chondrinema litorale]|uniref:hypothetical protein n=1 Tax=Chondrinema litorale TaxID=2994555 RepID=UPI0025439F78|nr:hypothetical protein [Chondrinema litorale]UZR98648.1 hypothetical protein OQ292_32995 [Chondrinema litorale]
MNELIQLYIVDYYYRPDNIIQDGKLSAWLQSPAFKQNLKDFLDNRGWRNRVVGTRLWELAKARVFDKINFEFATKESGIGASFSR